MKVNPDILVIVAVTSVELSLKYMMSLKKYRACCMLPMVFIYYMHFTSTQTLR